MQGNQQELRPVRLPVPPLARQIPAEFEVPYEAAQRKEPDQPAIDRGETYEAGSLEVEREVDPHIPNEVGVNSHCEEVFKEDGDRQGYWFGIDQFALVSTNLDSDSADPNVNSFFVHCSPNPEVLMD